MPLLLAACGGGGGTKTSTVGTATIDAAVTKTLAQGSEKVGVSGTVDLSGQTLKLNGTGAFGRRGGALHLDVDVPVVGKTGVDEIVVGKQSWIKTALAGNRWISVAGNPKALGFDARAFTGVTPSTALELLEGGTPKAVSPGHYLVSLDRTTGGIRFNSAEVWVDKQNLVQRVKLDFGANKVHTVLTITYSDFGTPVSVSPPQ